MTLTTAILCPSAARRVRQGKSAGPPPFVLLLITLGTNHLPRGKMKWGRRQGIL